MKKVICNFLGEHLYPFLIYEDETGTWWLRCGGFWGLKIP